MCQGCAILIGSKWILVLISKIFENIDIDIGIEFEFPSWKYRYRYWFRNRHCWNIDIDIDIEFVKNRIIDLKMAKEIKFFGPWWPFFGSLCSKISVSISKISILISISVRNRHFLNIDIGIDFEMDLLQISILISMSKQAFLQYWYWYWIRNHAPWILISVSNLKFEYRTPLSLLFCDWEKNMQNQQTLSQPLNRRFMETSLISLLKYILCF